MALHTKYRPQDFDTVVGHEEVVQSIASRLANDPPHAWMFCGPSGTGKTTLARIVARKLGATATGLVEVNIADLRGIDAIRELLRRAAYKAPGSPVNVFILDECHQMTTEAMNALLKSLEDSRPYCYYILCTTEPQKIINTIRTRCIEYNLRELSTDALAGLVEAVAEAEGIPIIPEVVDLIAENSGGSPRMALNFLEKVLPVAADRVAAGELIDDYTAMTLAEGPVEQAKALVELIASSDGWPAIVDWLYRHVLKDKSKVVPFKRALLAVLGNRLTKAPRSELAVMILSIESTLLGANTASGLIATVHELWSGNYFTKASAPERRTVSRRSLGASTGAATGLK